MPLSPRYVARLVVAVVATAVVVVAAAMLVTLTGGGLGEVLLVAELAVVCVAVGAMVRAVWRWALRARAVPRALAPILAADPDAQHPGFSGDAPAPPSRW